MDKLNELGGTETMHHSCCQARDPGGGGEKAERGVEGDRSGSRWQVAEKDDRSHPGQPTDKAEPALAGADSR